MPAAKTDASTAWCLGQCSVGAMIAAWLNQDTAHETFNTPPGIPARARLRMKRAVEAAIAVTALWDLASLSRQASRLGAHVRFGGVGATPRKNANGSPKLASRPARADDLGGVGVSA